MAHDGDREEVSVTGVSTGRSSFDSWAFWWWRWSMITLRRWQPWLHARELETLTWCSEGLKSRTIWAHNLDHLAGLSFVAWVADGGGDNDIDEAEDGCGSIANS